MRVRVLELPARWGRPLEALAGVEELVRGVDLAVLPEMALVGYVSPRGEFDLARFAEPIDGPTVRAAVEIARRQSVFLVVPLVLAEGRKLYNAAIVVGADGVVARYKKRHPWFPEQWATPGEEPYPVFEIGGVKTTLAICYDGHFLEHEASATLEGADLLVFTSAWVDEEDSRMPLLRSLARRFRIHVANANWGPGVVIVPGQGGSCILDPEGNVLGTETVFPETGNRQQATGNRQ
jgi:predicted amidohydrolase